jgi:hypothetical protein
MNQCFEVDHDPSESSTRREASRAIKNEQFPLFNPRATARPTHWPSRDTSHSLHPEGKSLFKLVTPNSALNGRGEYMDSDSILGLGCGPAGLRQSRGPLGKCSSCDRDGRLRT